MKILAPGIAIALLVMYGAATAGSVASSASSAGSASLKGSSNSIESSSTSSSGKDDKTAVVNDGQYRVAAVATGDEAGIMRLTLEPHEQGQFKTQSQAPQTFVLKVPAQAFGAQPPALGDIVRAQHRAYGVQFTRAEQPLLLVLAQAWDAELDSRPITP